jgi:hypothetical protein
MLVARPTEELVPWSMSIFAFRSALLLIVERGEVGPERVGEFERELQLDVSGAECTASRSSSVWCRR